MWSNEKKKKNLDILIIFLNSLIYRVDSMLWIKKIKKLATDH